MATCTFSGTISDQGGPRSGTLEVTLPNSTVDAIPVTSLADKTWTVTKEYPASGNYSATVKFPDQTTATAIYRACQATKAFTILVSVDSIVTINVAVA